MTDYYKPLTPDLRAKLNESIRNHVEELNTCEHNAIVNVQICGLNVVLNLINSLPDGTLLPFKRDE